jgi:CheY-like chemotaxis protein
MLDEETPPLRKKILVVDDQPYIRDVHVLLLRAAGYEATALASATEALARLSDVRPDLILLDMGMPGMNGRQFLARLRADPAWAELPVIVATGLGAEGLDALGDTTTDVLAKPFTEEALLATVRRLLGER